jgi:hypothetical protein
VEDASGSTFPIGRALVLALVAAALAVALSEGVRNRVLDALFGAEEEFDYVPTTVAPQSPTAV